jgi:RNA polymerase sigma-70 factor (ECF subfamily)
VALLLPDFPLALCTLALLLHQHRGRAPRPDGDGHLVLLADQDRARWDAEAIAEGRALLEWALPRTRGKPGPYALQAAIAAVHAEAPSADDTDWPQIAALYGRLADVQPSAVVRLNLAVAVAMAEGPDAGLVLVDALTPELGEYHHLHSARADLLRRSQRFDEAAVAYRAALDRCGNDAERAVLEGRLDEVSSRSTAPRPAARPDRT